MFSAIIAVPWPIVYFMEVTRGRAALYPMRTELCSAHAQYKRTSLRIVALYIGLLKAHPVPSRVGYTYRCFAYYKRVSITSTQNRCYYGQKNYKKFFHPLIK